ncbi:MAG TPA: LuxR C-terminal-related transcriptional regulator [Streptosporangiaceae bacterium]|nr:LuxR C-terminal-related transcriptional regulator [Streptosporangiaceae bacterium]
MVSRPVLWKRLDALVTVVSAPAGSGKTVLLRSWIEETGLADAAALVQVARGESDQQRWWLSVLDALRRTDAGSALVQALTAAPDLDGWAIVERLLNDLAPLRERLWLVLDDLHELASDDARRQLELLIMRAPPGLRFVLATRHDVRLGLHRLRLAGGLAELRAGDLQFSYAEARALFDAVGVNVSGPTLAKLVDRTEGWAAGLRLAALSLAGHPDPERFAAEFSGSERTVAEYLLAEVLGRQSPQIRRLLLRTSVLDRVNGELADLLTGESGGERTLQDLEDANAFVVSLDASRSWFRYHHLFADLLNLELRRAEPDQVTRLHQVACGWFDSRGHAVEAIRHAQSARDWRRASGLLADRWPGLYLDGQEGTVHALLAGFPAGMPAADPELASVAAASELSRGSLRSAERYLRTAERGLASAPPGRRHHAEVLFGVVRMLADGRGGNLPARNEAAQRLLAAAETLDAGQVGLGDELRALALGQIGDSETWAGRLDHAEAHLEQVLELARRAHRPYLELTALVYRAELELSRRFSRAEDLARQAIGVAERHGWTDDLFTGFAAMTLGSALAWQGQLDEAEPWIERALRIFTAEASPAAMGGHYVSGQFELGRGRVTAALAAFRTAQRLVGPHPLARPLQAWLLHAMVLPGDWEQAEVMLSGLTERHRGRAEIRIATAVLRLAQGDPAAATIELAPVLDGTVQTGWQSWLTEAYLLEAISRDTGGDPSGAGRALERALELAETDGALLWFLMHPAAGLLDEHARNGTARPVLLARIRGLVPGKHPAPPAPAPSALQPLSDREMRVLRYLPTHLSAPEIAVELSIATSTVKTHMRSLYAKLGAHSRAEAVQAARDLGLLARPA